MHNPSRLRTGHYILCFKAESYIGNDKNLRGKVAPREHDRTVVHDSRVRINRLHVFSDLDVLGPLRVVIVDFYQSTGAAGHVPRATLVGNLARVQHLSFSSCFWFHIYHYYMAD